MQTWAEYAALHFGPERPLILGGLSMGVDLVVAPRSTVIILR